MTCAGFWMVSGFDFGNSSVLKQQLPLAAPPIAGLEVPAADPCKGPHLACLYFFFHKMRPSVPTTHIFGRFKWASHAQASLPSPKTPPVYFCPVA